MRHRTPAQRQATSEAMKRSWERRREAQRLTQPSRVTLAQGSSARTTNMQYAKTNEIIEFLSNMDQQELAAIRSAPRGAGQIRDLREKIGNALHCRQPTPFQMRGVWKKLDELSEQPHKRFSLPAPLAKQAQEYRQNQDKLRDAILGQNGEEKKVPLLQRMAQLEESNRRIEQGLALVMNALGTEE